MEGMSFLFPHNAVLIVLESGLLDPGLPAHSK